MGSRGPVPKRSAERRRRNKDDVPVESVSAPSMAVSQPPADEMWHEIARDWYVSLAASGQARFYEPSDWQTARFVAEAMTRNLNASRFSAQMFAAVMSAMTELLTTEGARRRARMEIDRRDEGESQQGVTVLDDYRAALGG